MDLSSAGGALLITILRLLHIVAGLVWVGAALLMSLYIEPTSETVGADGKKFLRSLYGNTSLPRLIPLSAIVTTLAGLLLYGMLTYHEAMSTAMGIILTLGALFGLLAFGHGYFTVWRGAGHYAGLVQADGAEEQTLAQLEEKMRRNGRVSMWLALVSLVLMAGARYAGPIFA